MNKSRFDIWSFFWAVLAFLYFFIPLYGTLDFSLRMKKGEISLQAYSIVLSDPQFLRSFQYSIMMGIISVSISILIFVPTVYWLYLKMPKARPIVEIITILPFVIPVIVYVYGINTTFGRPPFRMTFNTFTTDILMVGGYIVL